MTVFIVACQLCQILCWHYALCFPPSSCYTNYAGINDSIASYAVAVDVHIPAYLYDFGDNQEITSY